MGSNQRNRPAGLLQAELHQLNSFILRCAVDSAIPAGESLAVDRDRFALLVTDRLGNSPNINIIRAEVTNIPDEPTIIATGPLTSSGMAAEIARITGSEFLFFFDAIAPIVALDSIDMNKAFWGSRYAFDKENQGDYLNCPFSEAEYRFFIR
jgi:methylenetetrahydrofolate--tRNA-(uracil-5-)-methyltransferase